MQSRMDWIRRHSGWLLLLAGGLLLPLITDVGASWLQTTFGQTSSHLIRLLAVLVAVAVAFWVLGLALRPRPEPMVLVPRSARPRPHRGLVALVGKGRPGIEPEPLKQPAARAIRYHLGEGKEKTLKVCWLVASAGETGSIAMAREIQKAYQSPDLRIEICQVGDAFSVQDSYDAVQRIYNQEIYKDEFRSLDLKPEDVIADFTSGTAPMTAGMALACGRYRPMQYTVWREARTRDEADIAPLPLLVEFRPTPRRTRRP